MFSKDLEKRSFAWERRPLLPGSSMIMLLTTLLCTSVPGKAQFANTAPAPSLQFRLGSSKLLFNSKKILERHSFDGIETIQVALITTLNEVHIEGFQDACYAWKNCWQKCVDALKISKHIM